MSTQRRGAAVYSCTHPDNIDGGLATPRRAGHLVAYDPPCVRLSSCMCMLICSVFCCVVYASSLSCSHNGTCQRNEGGRPLIRACTHPDNIDGGHATPRRAGHLVAYDPPCVRLSSCMFMCTSLQSTGFVFCDPTILVDTASSMRGCLLIIVFLIL